MSIKVYNTLTRRKEEFVPLKSRNVSMYVCGPTVYDEPHIGHLRSAYIFEVIRNYLKYKGYDVKFVRNVTDIDDKIIEKAQKQSKSVSEVSDYYLKRYHEVLDAFEITPPDIEPKATSHINGMIEMIKGLIAKGYAYEVDGDVYFDVHRFKGYGRLSNRFIDELEPFDSLRSLRANAELVEAEPSTRVKTDEKKRDPLDFALWKRSKKDEPFWESPWGKGRPGWHIECSVMSNHYLGETFDFHCGGIDLIFPHHENEIAQSESFTGKVFARYWLHNGLLTVQGEKMSKSLGNFITLQEVKERYDIEVLKLFFLDTHYSHPIDFTWDKMEQMRNALERFYVLLDTPYIDNENIVHIQTKQAFEDAMDDNFNTPAALASLFDFVSLAHKTPFKGMRFTLTQLGRVFGLFTAIEIKGGVDEHIKELVRQRDDARKCGDFKTADSIRSELLKKGVILEDKKDRTIWRIKR